MNHFYSFYRQIEETAGKTFPSLREYPSTTWDHLISPYSIELSKAHYQKAQTAIHAFFHLSRRESYQQYLEEKTVFPFSTPNDSVLMAYDFHSDESGGLHLVEINTNASGYLFATLMNCAHENVSLESSKYLETLRESFLLENDGQPPKSAAIVDDDVLNQKMYPEFLMYRDLFGKWKSQAVIGEASAFALDRGLKLDRQSVDFVYNRSTDFYLEAPEHAALRKAWETGAARVSPQPREYFRLADKQRLVDFTKSGWLEEAGATEEEVKALSHVLIPTRSQADFENVDAIWTERKHLFFKPRQSYGGKSVYRGESVSRKVFERLMEQDILIQNYVPPQKMAAAPEDPLSNWKFDVRFFVYRDQIQQVAARLYQGQVTNFSTQFGGFTQVKFK